MSNKEFMSVTKNGLVMPANQAIFPLMKQLDAENWELVGTAAFIANNGLFLTAKHVMEDVFDTNKTQAYRFAGFNFSNGHCQIREIRSGFLLHCGDIALGYLHDVYNTNGHPVLNPFHGIYSTPIENGSEIHTFAYPLTQCSPNKINFKATYANGKTLEYYPVRRDASMLNGPCYETNMSILKGASGGPVFNSEGNIIGINSSSFDLSDGLPVSFVSAIPEALLKELQNHQYSIAIDN